MFLVFCFTKCWIIPVFRACMPPSLVTKAFCHATIVAPGEPFGTKAPAQRTASKHAGSQSARSIQTALGSGAYHWHTIWMKTIMAICQVRLATEGSTVACAIRHTGAFSPKGSTWAIRSGVRELFNYQTWLIPCGPYKGEKQYPDTVRHESVKGITAKREGKMKSIKGMKLLIHESLKTGRKGQEDFPFWCR